MATPLAHTLAGYVVYRFAGSRDRTLLVAAVVLAVCPDFDFIPGLLIDQPVRFHHGISHSLGAGVAVATAVWLALPALRRVGARAWWVLFAAFATHLGIDFWGPDQRPPYGIPILWPMDDTYRMAPFPLILGVRHANEITADTMTWVGQILHPYNLAAVALELLWLSPFVWAAKRRTRGGTVGDSD